MLIQFNANNQLEGAQAQREELTELISDSLERFDEHVTRIEVHLGDENGNKEGNADKRCSLEARVEGREPIAVIHHAENYEYAVRGAVDKLEGVLDKMVERMRNY